MMAITNKIRASIATAATAGDIMFFGLHIEGGMTAMPMFLEFHNQNTGHTIVVECRVNHNPINLEAHPIVQEEASWCTAAIARNWNLHTHVYN